jgi:mRNA interferase MazF
MRLFVVCDGWDVVVVPFPFTDSPEAKRRPAVVLSARRFNQSGHSVMCMVTTSRSARWPGDIELPLRESGAIGLPEQSIIRTMKIFTLDNRIILRKIGTLGEDLRDTALRLLHTHLWGLSP